MIILIDDDHLIHLGWKLKATKLNLPLQCFSTIEQFLNVEQTIPRSSMIYVDSSLKNNIQGENESRKIYDLGFKNIYLVTGYEPSSFNLNELFWIKKVLPKSPPF